MNWREETTKKFVEEKGVPLPFWMELLHQSFVFFSVR